MSTAFAMSAQTRRETDWAKAQQAQKANINTNTEVCVGGGGEKLL